MAYRLRPDRPFTQELRSVAQSQLERAIDVLQSQPDGPHQAIHAARKRFKRVRALYRLVGIEAKVLRKAENARIRDMARSLAAVRDASALVETTTYLAAYASSSDEVAALAAAAEALGKRRDHIAKAEHDLPAKLASAVETCREAIAALSGLDLDDRPGKAARRLEKVWKRQLSKAHVALALCSPAPAGVSRIDCGDSEEAFHGLRKRGQAYWMHLALFSDAWPSAMRAKQAQAKALVDLLGHEHDLSVLSGLIDEDPSVVGNAETAAHLLGAIITRQQALRAEALALAALVFSDRPAREAQSISLLWETAARASS